MVGEEDEKIKGKEKQRERGFRKKKKRASKLLMYGESLLRGLGFSFNVIHIYIYIIRTHDFHYSHFLISMSNNMVAF